MRDLAGSNYTAGDLLLAKRRCRRMIGAHRPLPELLEETEITILIPVYNESVKRLRKQIIAFSKQDIGRRIFELVFIVNNGFSDGSDRFDAVYRANQRAIAFLKKKQLCTVRVIDRSSPSSEIRDCNVGKARQFGLHVVAARYLGQNRDGIVIHTDADTFPARQDYLRRVLRDVKPSRCFGASGGVRYMLDMDSMSQKDKEFFSKHIGAFRDYSEWHFLNKVMHEKSLRPMMTPLRFSGAHMISKAIAAVCAGGIPGLAHGEDIAFGEALLAFAKKRRAYLLSGRMKNWVLVTALRESDRTGAAHGPTFENIRAHGGKPLARPEGAPTTFQFVTQRLLPAVRNQRGIKKVVRDLQTVSSEIEPRKAANALLRLSRRIKPGMTRDQRFKAFEAWKRVESNQDVAKLILRWYSKKYPREPLTHAKVVALRKKVFKNPRRKAYVLNAADAFGDFRLPNQI